MLADESMCNGHNCDRRLECERFINFKPTDHPWQNYIYSIDCIKHNYIAQLLV